VVGVLGSQYRFEALVRLQVYIGDDIGSTLVFYLRFLAEMGFEDFPGFPRRLGSYLESAFTALG
jgi:hypothetical protein